MVDEDAEPMPNQQVRGAPSDNTTLVAVLDDFIGDGWVENMTVTEDGPRVLTVDDDAA